MKIIFVPILIFALGQTAFAGDWPRWRGAGHDDISIETGLLRSWPSGGPKRLWLSEDIGFGYSTPSVAGGRLFILGTKDGKEHLFTKDLKTGKTQWAIPLNSRFSNNWGDGPRGAATVDGDRVYALGAKGGVQGPGSNMLFSRARQEKQVIFGHAWLRVIHSLSLCKFGAS